MANVNDSEVQKVLENLPDGAAYIFNLVAPAFLKHGASWGCIFNKGEYEKHKNDFASASQFIAERSVFDGGDSCGFVLSPQLIQAVIKAVMPELPSDTVRNKVIEAEKMREAECKRFRDFLVKLNRADNDGAMANANIALYCINKDNYLTHNGVKYNAFRITVTDMIRVINTLGYQTAFGIGPVEELANKTGNNDIIDTRTMGFTKNMMTVVRTDAEINDSYLAGVTFKLLFKQVSETTKR